MEHLPQLDVIRGVACLMVLIVHLRDARGLHGLPDVAATAGVGLFFALSGFLITRILLADRAEGRGLNAFYNRRAARIFPIYYLTLAVIALWWPGKELWWAATFSFNLQYVTGVAEYFHAGAGANPIPPVAHFWSLCVEEHFYWVWPAIVAFTPARFYRWVPAMVIAATPLVTWQLIRMLEVRQFSSIEIEGLVSRLTMTQLVALSLGAWTALHEDKIFRPQRVFGRNVPMILVLGLFLGAFSLLAWKILNEEEDLLWRPTVLHGICGGAFMLGLGSPWLGRCWPLARVGTISYGLYLYHLPIYAALGLAAPGGDKPLWIAGLALLLTVGAAMISYRFLEGPILSWARRRQYRTLFGAGRLRLSTGTGLTLLVFASSIGALAFSYLNLAGLPETFARATGVSDVNMARIDTIVLGTSEALDGVATPNLPGFALNLARDSQDLYYDCAITEKCLDRLPNLKRVVFAVSFFSLRYALSEFPDQAWRETIYYHAWGIESRNKTGPRDYNVLAAAQHKISHHGSTQGWSPQEGVGTPNTLDAEVKNLSSFIQPQWVQENKERLIKTINLCKARNIEVVIVTIPVPGRFLQRFDPTIVPELTAVLTEVSEQTGVRFLDYTTDPRFDANDYMDAHHLNRQGALKFTAILARDVYK
jgi:peptidoglycan/LPS O-acetylase OafA/YrhL